MANKRPLRVPSLRRHKASDRAFVELNGRYVYLGPWNSSVSKTEYERVIAEWLSNGRRLCADEYTFSVTELCAAYWAHAKGYYVERAEDVGDAVTEALAGNVPAIIEIPVDPNELPRPARLVESGR